MGATLTGFPGYETLLDSSAESDAFCDLLTPIEDDSYACPGAGDYYYGMLNFFAGSDVTLTGLNFRKGEKPFNDESFGGCLLSQDGKIEIEGVTFTSCSSPWGGAMAIRDGTATLSQIEVTSSLASTGGGGLYLTGTTAMLTDINFTKCSQVAHVAFADSRSAAGGGAIFAFYSVLTMTNLNVKSSNIPTEMGSVSSEYTCLNYWYEKGTHLPSHVCMPTHARAQTYPHTHAYTPAWLY